jgi:hypothetical protein
LARRPALCGPSGLVPLTVEANGKATSSANVNASSGSELDLHLFSSAAYVETFDAASVNGLPEGGFSDFFSVDKTYDTLAIEVVLLASAAAQIWGEGETSSSDGQYFQAGGHGEAIADVNARHGDEPGVSFYTHVSDQFSPYHTKVIAATASEARHVLDGLLNHQSGLRIEEHYTDRGGATDHVFGLCHALGFRFAPSVFRNVAMRR